MNDEITQIPEDETDGKRDAVEGAVQASTEPEGSDKLSQPSPKAHTITHNGDGSIVEEGLIEGVWDCPYCRAKAIGAFTKKCPRCGAPQDDNVRFYVGEAHDYLDDETASKYGNGADWFCPFCHTLNNQSRDTCSNCGSAKADAKDDYFSASMVSEKEENRVSGDEVDRMRREKAQVEEAIRQRTGNGGIGRFFSRHWKLLAVLAAILVALGFATCSHEFDATVDDMSWSREVQIEQYGTVHESDWVVPEGARITDQRREIHHYDHVLDHYETVTETYYEQVQDGYSTSTEYVDQGDGSFKMKQTQTPKYKSVPKTRQVQKPVYKDVPSYQTKYYYDIEKWHYGRSVKAEGTRGTPVAWPELDLADENERAGEKSERYVAAFSDENGKAHEVELPQSEWEKMNPGDVVKVIINNMGVVSKINGYEL